MPAQFPIIFVIAAIVLIAGFAIAGSRKRKGRDITVPAPERLRDDLLFGYYGHQGEQAAETRDHVNLVWCWDFLNPDTAADVLMQYPEEVFGVLDCAPYLWTKRPQQPRPDAEQALRACFLRLRERGMLTRVKMLVPLDEPNLSANDTTCAHPPWAHDMMKRVAAEFAELAAVKLGCVYLGGKAMPHLGLWDVAGFDEYDERSAILTPAGAYSRFKANLKAGAHTLLFPGGYSDCKQDPTPFINFAHANPEVLAVVPFLWCSVPWESFKGIRDVPEVKDKYVAAGLSIVNKGA